jgi:hypothetical protein
VKYSNLKGKNLSQEPLFISYEKINGGVYDKKKIIDMSYIDWICSRNSNY